jgi:hypothetical protein
MERIAGLETAWLNSCILILLVEDSSSTSTNRCKHFGVGRNGRLSGGYRSRGASQDAPITSSGFRKTVHMSQDADDRSLMPGMTD